MSERTNSRYFQVCNTDTPSEDTVRKERQMKTASTIFPETIQERDTFRTKSGKPITPHQWAVYDFALTIPKGKVITYKDVAGSAGGSPRSVGNALRNNPFSPYVPCHRVIASNHFVGGFFGEWGKDHKTGTRYNEKVEILSQEGVRFSDNGRLLSPDEVLWKP
ncbi:hypothetical protein M413DRAFT_26679 [Hebeloma cylindrosporum]|uniref:Methylated-DNA--protein-cysteine methyltransferase n=1 Tax=Hebeloma cylindrosporum TaxID=76867 RepID=A0A0C2XYG7_HEBCY|nr:hypothetical protein M413DRAFT_26679 [Hebeloma cylindrosporum h7]